MRRLTKIVLCLTLLGVPVNVSWAEEDGEWFTEEFRVSRRTAVILSALAPGVGQMASGSKVKGGGFFVGALTTMMVAVDANEQVHTRTELYRGLVRQHASLLGAGKEERAAAVWDAALRQRRQVDGLQSRRDIFGGAALCIYLLNVADIVLGQSEDARQASAVGERGSARIAVRPLSTAAGIAVVRFF